MPELSKDLSTHVTDESVNTVAHMVGAILAIFGTGLLVAQSALAQDWWHLAGFIIYGFGVINLFVISSLHHGVNGSEKVNKHLRTLDYVAIYIMILGTFAPICLVMFRDVFGFVVLGTIALVAAFGITMRSIFTDLPGYISQTLYVMMGWLPILLPLLTDVVIPARGIALLVAGGLFYSVGAIIYGLERPNPIPGKFGFHEIWHIAVLLGALSHFLFLYVYVLPL